MAHQRHAPRRDGYRSDSYPWDTTSDFSDLTWSDGLPAFFEEAPEKRGDAEELVQSVMQNLLQDNVSNERLQETVDAFYARYSAKQRTEKLTAIITRTDDVVRDPARDSFGNCVLWSSLASTFVCFVIFYARGSGAYAEHNAIFEGAALSQSVRSSGFSYALYFTIGTCLPMCVQEANQWVAVRLLQVNGKGGQRAGLALGQGQGGAEEAKAQSWLPPPSFHFTRLVVLLVILVPTVVMLGILAVPSIHVNAPAFFVVSTFWQYCVIVAIGIGFCEKYAPVVHRGYMIALFHAFNVGAVMQLWAIFSRDFERRIIPGYACLAVETAMYNFYFFRLLLAIWRGDFTSPLDGTLTASGSVALGVNAMFVLMIILDYGWGIYIGTINFAAFSELTCCYVVYVKTICVVFLATLTTRWVNLHHDATKNKFRNMLVPEVGGRSGQGQGQMGLQQPPEPPADESCGGSAGRGRSASGGLEAAPPFSPESTQSGEQSGSVTSKKTSPPLLRSLRWHENEEIESNADTTLA